ncbi:hypothetical protein AOLI_G00079360 [Acnodon oligacanthus]
MTPAAMHAASRASIAPDTPAHTSTVTDGNQEQRGNTGAERKQPRASQATWRAAAGYEFTVVRVQLDGNRYPTAQALPQSSRASG